MGFLGQQFTGRDQESPILPPSQLPSPYPLLSPASIYHGGMLRPHAGVQFLTMPDNLQSESLAWALTHVQRFGDTDIFPVPFEYKAIAHNWDFVGRHLNTLDFASHKIFSDRRVMVIKPGGGFRAAVQLDPFDQLLYTAAVYECADQSRRPVFPQSSGSPVPTECRSPPKAHFSPLTAVGKTSIRTRSNWQRVRRVHMSC